MPEEYQKVDEGRQEVFPPPLGRPFWNLPTRRLGRASSCGRSCIPWELGRYCLPKAHGIQADWRWLKSMKAAADAVL